MRNANRRGGRGVSLIMQMFRSFNFNGHYCLVFESMGRSLYDFLKRHDYRYVCGGAVAPIAARVLI